MKAQLLAVATAAAWGLGGYFEKKGLAAGGLAPQVGATLRTLVALLVLAVVSGPALRQLAGAKPAALVAIAIGGGVVAGGLGILCFYAALRAAPIQQVMPIAFTSPLFGVAAAVVLGSEKLTLRDWCGMALTLAGVAILGSR
jgi:transporter family protein